MCRQGDKVVLEGEADQVPDQEPGDIIFVITEQPHSVFQRSGADLKATIQVDLVEALCGFSRVIIKHLDGRGISITYPQSSQKGSLSQVIKVRGEGMWHKKSDSKGDLYLQIDIQYPRYEWLEQNNALEKLREALPKHDPAPNPEEIDEVEYNGEANMNDFGGSGQEDGEWEDDEDEGQPQCRQQ